MVSFNPNILLLAPMPPLAPVMGFAPMQQETAEMGKRKRGCKYGARRHGRCPARKR